MHLALEPRERIPDLHRALGIDKAFLDGMVEDGPVREGLPEIVRPRVYMGIKMDKPQRALFAWTEREAAAA